MDTIYNISNFDENIFDYIIWLKAQEGKKRNKDNKENSQKLNQQERLINEVRKYLPATNDFYEIKRNYQIWSALHLARGYLWLGLRDSIWRE